MKKVFVAGHEGMVGSAIHRQLAPIKHIQLVTASRSELDLTEQAEVRAFFASQKIDEVHW